MKPGPKPGTPQSAAHRARSAENLLKARAARAMKPQRDPMDRFWSLVVKGDGCWLWQGALDGHGYGCFHVPGTKNGVIRATRWIFATTNGAIPDGMDVCHHCDNPPCVNPAHLFLGTAKDNMHDAIKKGRFARHWEAMRAKQRERMKNPRIRAKALANLLPFQFRKGT